MFTEEELLASEQKSDPAVTDLSLTTALGQLAVEKPSELLHWEGGGRHWEPLEESRSERAEVAVARSSPSLARIGSSCRAW